MQLHVTHRSQPSNVCVVDTSYRSHCLVCEFNEEQPKPKLRRVRHYLDSALLVNLLAGNEKL